MRVALWSMVVSTLVTGSAVAGGNSTSSVQGNWKTPSGSVVKIHPCGNKVCLTLMQIEKSAPGTVDANNPDPKLRSRSLCGLQMGTGFKLDSDGRSADGGSLYDPKSGKTYSGSIAADGDVLHLRGYVGLKVFGRTEDWSRVNEPTENCQAT